MAKIYTVVRAHAAPLKGGGEVWLTRANEHEIPALLPAQAIRDRVKSGAITEQDDGVPEPAEAEEEDSPASRSRASSRRKE